MHPLSPSCKLARLLRRSYAERLDLAACATSLGVSPSRLRRAFKREYGQSIGEYQRCARIVAALELGASRNVAHVAREVGYRSKKNFYRAFAKLTGTTPAAFHRLNPGRRHEIVESTRLTLSLRGAV